MHECLVSVDSVCGCQMSQCLGKKKLLCFFEEKISLKS